MPTGRLIDVALPRVSSQQFQAETVAAFRKLIEQLNTQLDATGQIAGNVITNLSKDAYYAARFTVSDWQGPDTDGYYITIAHNMNTYNLSVDLWKENFEERVLVFASKVAKLTNNTIRIWVTDNPDYRFAGRAFIMARPDPVPSTASGGGGSSPAAPFVPTESLRLQLPMELPYAWNNTGTIRLTYFASKDKEILEGFQLLGGTDAYNLNLLKQDGSFSYSGTLAREYKKSTLELDDTGFLMTPVNRTNFELFHQFGGNEARNDLLTLRRRICIIGNEIMCIQLVQESGNTLYRVRGVIRGLFDTVPATHAFGSPVFFWRENAPPFTVTEQVGWDNGLSLMFKAVPYTVSAEAYLNYVGTRNLTLTKRAVRPYAVQNLAVDGNGSNPIYSEGVPSRLTWLARHRDNNGALDDTGYDFESGIDFVVRLFDPDGNQICSPATVANTQTVVDGWGVTRLYHDFTIASESGYEYVVARVNARLNGLESLDTLNLQQITVRRAD